MGWSCCSPPSAPSIPSWGCLGPLGQPPAPRQWAVAVCHYQRSRSFAARPLRAAQLPQTRTTAASTGTLLPSLLLLSPPFLHSAVLRLGPLPSLRSARLHGLANSDPGAAIRPTPTPPVRPSASRTQHCINQLAPASHEMAWVLRAGPRPASSQRLPATHVPADYSLHPATPHGGDQAVMPTPRGRRRPPSLQGGGA